MDRRRASSETQSSALSARHFELSVNGQPHPVSCEPRKLLADVLRQDLGLTGTHVGCEHGVCGACTILMDGEPVRSCLLFAVQARGAELTTVEGLAEGAELHPIQQAFWECFGLQCGFCTPGFLMTALAFLREHPAPTRAEIREALAGNLCRCTGYHTIVDAVEAAAARLRGQEPGSPRSRGQGPGARSQGWGSNASTEGKHEP